MSKRFWAGVCLALAVSVTSAVASPVVTPAGLNPGDTYRLIFITSQTTPASSTSIAFYNGFVSTDANSNSTLAALSVSWLAIGSTSTVDALTNIGNLAAPVYSLNGTKIGTSTADLFDSSILSKVNLDENGNVVGGLQYAWTGSTAGGVKQATDVLGSQNPEVGDSGQTNGTWLAAFHAGNSTAGIHMYGISGVLTVPGVAAVPEPGTVGPALLGAALILAARIRRSPKA